MFNVMERMLTVYQVFQVTSQTVCTVMMVKPFDLVCLRMLQLVPVVSDVFPMLTREVRFSK